MWLVIIVVAVLVVFAGLAMIGCLMLAHVAAHVEDPVVDDMYRRLGSEPRITKDPSEP